MFGSYSFLLLLLPCLTIVFLCWQIRSDLINQFLHEAVKALGMDVYVCLNLLFLLTVQLWNNLYCFNIFWQATSCESWCLQGTFRALTWSKQRNHWVWNDVFIFITWKSSQWGTWLWKSRRLIFHKIQYIN